MTTISIRADLKPLQKAFIDLRGRQAPFATSLALNALASGVREAEREEVMETFDSPTPFTVNAFFVKPANKATPVASVVPKDVQAEYLAPYVNGGERSLGSKRAMLVPRQVGLNQYGNLPRGRLAALKGKPGVFIGQVKSKRTGRVISGVWQRPVAKGPKVIGGLKLLVQFEDTTEAPKHLDFYARAETYIHANAAAAFDVAIRKALSTARK